MADRVFGWRKVALVLASAGHAELLDYLGVQAVEPAARDWARRQLDVVEDFYEVFDTDPDGGAAADALEDALGRLVDPSVLVALREGALLFSRPIDGDLDDWTKVLFGLSYQDTPDVPLPRHPLRDDLRARVLEISSGIADPGAVANPPVPDEWEVSFARRHGIWSADVARDWAELRRMREIASRLTQKLRPQEREEFEGWAQAEMYSDPRPPNWPPAPHLSLARAARGSVRERVTFTDAD
jgi:hypothetical protein